MYSLDSSLIDTYRIATFPTRTAMRWWMQAAGTLPIGVLYYHRVSDHTMNDWTISLRDFRRQIRWLADHFEIISLEELQLRIRSGSNRRPAIALTFDDGYADNCEWAVPHLIERKIPFTYFVTLENVLKNRPFDHDVRLSQPLSPNTIEQLRTMADAGVEIGGHTRTHCDLGLVTREAEIVDEVFDSIDELQALINKPVRYFAFPYGMLPNLNKTVFRIARDRGLLGVCSAYGGFNFPGGDAFHIKRVHGDTNLSRLKNWMTYDHRVLHSPDFDY
jgi:peptidoglycan/xylan/chitin deacetylase (PgdA/CDA1 family)